MVGEGGLEPPTSSLSDLRSNQAELPAHERPTPAVASVYTRESQKGLPGAGWSGWADSNRRLPAPEAGALPGCATPRWVVGCFISRRPTTQARGICLSASPPYRLLQAGTPDRIRTGDLLSESQVSLTTRRREQNGGGVRPFGLNAGLVPTPRRRSFPKHTREPDQRGNPTRFSSARRT